MAFNNFVSGIKSLWNGTYDDFRDIVIPSITGATSAPFDLSNADKISVVYTCINTLASTLSRMPLNIYSDEGEGRTVDKEDYRYPILHYQPNSWTSQQTFFSTLEYWRNIRGNSFARIYRDKSGKVVSLVIIPPSNVIHYEVQNGELYYAVINDKNETEIVSASEILHFKGLSRDGIWGMNPIEALRQHLSSSYQGLQTIDSFYKNHAMVPKALKSTISGANQKAMIEALEEFNRKYAGATKAGALATLPPNTDVVDMGMNIVDVDFINTLKFNATQIAALYGVPAHMVGILEQTKFASVEVTLLDFKASTLAAIGRMYRQELESKLLTTSERIAGKSIEFNWNALVEVDSVSRINNLKTLQGMGVVTANDVAKLEGFATYEGGDVHIVPGNYVPVDQLGKKPSSNV